MHESLSPRQSAPSQPADISGRLTSRELRRRVWHMGLGLLPLILQIVPHQDPISVTLRWILVAVIAVIGLRILFGFRQIQRTVEQGGTAAVAGYTLSVLVMVLLFPQHLEIAFSLLAILAFGDGSATLFGLLIRGPRLPWNRSKTCSGLGAFVIVGTLMSAWIYRGESLNPEAIDVSVSFLTALKLVSPAVIVAAICESVDSRINDNIRVGIAGAIVLMITHLWHPV